MRFRILSICVLSMLACICGPKIAVAADTPSRSTASGALVDSKGVHHQWEINGNHALYWDGKPYTPIGVVLPSVFLSGAPTDDNWRTDISTLRAFKKAGLNEVLLEPTGTTGALNGLPAATIQGLLDVLDSSGFTYGFDLDGATPTTWDAALVNPAIYRSPAPAAGSTVLFRNIPDVVKASYFLVSSPDGRVIASGDAKVIDNETVSVTLPPDTGGEHSVLLLYPEAKMSPDGADGRRIPDIWSSADGYRDSMLLYLSRIRFGKGLRYFLDPLRVRSSLFTEADGGIIPVSDSFRIQFQAWLMKKYSGSIVQLRDGWGVKNNDITDYATAVRCQALWFESKGVALLFDSAKSKTYEVLPVRSRYWDDVRDFEREAVQRNMNALADALKQGVADVPVLYTCSKLNSVYVNLKLSGFDGLCVDAVRHGDNIIQDGAGYAFAEVEQSRRTQWLIVRAQPSSQTDSRELVGNSGSPGRGVLTADRSASESIGVKGFYLEPPAVNGWTAGDTSWLNWIRADHATRSVDAEEFASSKPRTIFYPVNIALHHPEVEQVAPWVWWLPTFEKGEETDVGRTLYAYSLKNAGGIRTFVVWAASGAQTEAKFTFPKGAHPDVTGPDGIPIPVAQKKNVATIVFSGTPSIVSHVTDLPLPDGAVKKELAEAGRLVELAEKAKIPVTPYAQRIFYISNTVEPNKDSDSTAAYLTVRDVINELSVLTMPFTWIEGEAASQQNFECVVSSPSASGKSFLWVDTAHDPPGNTAAYSASYKFAVNAPAEYTIWASMAPGPPGSTNTSPIIFRVDQQPPVDVNLPLVAGSPYCPLPFADAPADGAFTWCNLGTVKLTSGQHQLIITVAGRAVGTNRYTLGIDALNITRGQFEPKGTEKPSN